MRVRFIPMGIVLIFLQSCWLFEDKSAGGRDLKFSNQEKVEKKKFGIVITTFDYPHLLQATLHSLAHSRLMDANIVIVDDASGDPRSVTTLRDFNVLNVPISKIRFPESSGGIKALIAGFDTIKDSVEYLVTLDAETLVRGDWLYRLESLYNKLGKADVILTGFNSSARAPVSCADEYCVKTNVAGVNYFFTAKFYKDYLRDWLQDIPDDKWQTWDTVINERMGDKSFAFYASKPSVVQHIGTTRFTAKNDQAADWADDFDFSTVY